MSKYTPILRGKLAEIMAWQRASSAVIEASSPVFVLVPDEGPANELTKFVNLIKQYPPPGQVTVDTSHVSQQLADSGAVDRGILWTFRTLLLNDVEAKPTLRPGDDPLTLAEVSEAASLHRNGACLRLGSNENFPTETVATWFWPRVCQETGLTAREIDLLIDLGAVLDRLDVDRAIHAARHMLDWAHQNGPWRSVIVASGAFPESIQECSAGKVTPVYRYDAELFVNLMCGDRPINFDFGDYAVWHPSMKSGPRRSPMPNLRYTNQLDWQIYRERKVLPGNDSFYTLCEKVVASNHWPQAGADYSAGDAEIARCALAIPGPGTAT